MSVVSPEFTFSKKMLDRNQIRQEFDPNNTYIIHRGRNGRNLVSLTDGVFLNAEISGDPGIPIDRALLNLGDESEA